ncbi:hypothetical protein QS460_10070 [Liquorilactobacillus mali]|uniref:hypothetical protein n=1 Tax=Liquorilactobacillus mali TaxID=1618 RepID=UPI002654D57A|nr:hypothetical protein [Liquorilactobacillus mali]MDN7146273.1 hypothetical protein [Liquorilactobacillus mali]
MSIFQSVLSNLLIGVMLTKEFYASKSSIYLSSLVAVGEAAKGWIAQYPHRLIASSLLNSIL